MNSVGPALKNITVSVDEETYRQARIAAAERNSSVSRLVREYLRSLAAVREADAQGAAALFAVLDKAKGFRAGERMSRDQVHAR